MLFSLSSFIKVSPCMIFDLLLLNHFLDTIWALFLFIVYSHIAISCLAIFKPSMNTRFLFDPLYEEILTNTSELLPYLTRHFFIELLFPLSFFIAVMLTLLVDWSWIPISSIDRIRGNSLEEVKRNLIEW